MDLEQSASLCPLMRKPYAFTQIARGTSQNDIRDGNLASLATHSGLVITGAMIWAAGTTTCNFGFAVFPFNQGDILTCTLTQNVQIFPTHTTNTAGPQKKTFILTQDGTGGHTVTWPKSRTPSLDNWQVYWAGGTAPTMTSAAGATDVYELVTFDGIHWYGRVLQNMS